MEREMAKVTGATVTGCKHGCPSSWKAKAKALAYTHTCQTSLNCTPKRSDCHCWRPREQVPKAAGCNYVRLSASAQTAYGRTGSRDKQTERGIRQGHKPKPFHQSLGNTKTLPTVTAEESKQVSLLRSQGTGSSSYVNSQQEASQVGERWGQDRGPKRLFHR